MISGSITITVNGTDHDHYTIVSIDMRPFCDLRLADGIDLQHIINNLTERIVNERETSTDQSKVMMNTSKAQIQTKN